MQLVATNFGVLGLDAEADDPSYAVGGVVAILNEVFSQGTLAISDADASVEPTVEENMAADPRDVARLVDAAERLLAMGETEAVAAAAVEGEPIGLTVRSPGTGVTAGGSLLAKADCKLTA